MPLRIADYVFSGDLRNTRRNSVFGWIEFAPDYGIRIELTGNFSGELAGKHIRFTMPLRDSSKVFEPGSFPEHIEDLSDRQIGVVQKMDLRRTTVPALPIDDFLQLPEAERTGNLVEKDCLYLEWASQDGAVVSELIEPVIEFVDDEMEATISEHDEFDGVDFYDVEADDVQFSSSAELILGNSELLPDQEESGDLNDLDDEDDEDDEEDPYGLFDSGLQRSVNESLGNDSRDSEHPRLPEGLAESHGWDELIPGVGSTAEMFEQFGEIFEGKKDEPISYLFPTPLKLPKPEHVTSEEEAEGLVKSILAQLALLSVALDVCEHFTMQQTYRLLLEDILPTAKVHPNLAASEMVQHYATSDYCDACYVEFEAEYESGKDDSDELGGDDLGEVNHPEDD